MSHRLQHVSFVKKRCPRAARRAARCRCGRDKRVVWPCRQVAPVCVLQKWRGERYGRGLVLCVLVVAGAYQVLTGGLHSLRLAYNCAPRQSRDSGAATRAPPLCSCLARWALRAASGRVDGSRLLRYLCYTELFKSLPDDIVAFELARPCQLPCLHR